MFDSLTDLILSLTPEDGSSIGDGAMLALLREQVPGLALSTTPVMVVTASDCSPIPVATNIPLT